MGDAESSGGLTLPEVFAQAARREPQAVALTDEHGSSRTWEQLAAEVQSVARGLQQLGVGAGDAVAVQLPNGVDLASVVLAVATAGAVLLPVHVGYGEADAAALLDRMEPAALVCAAGSTVLSLVTSGGAPKSLRAVLIGDGEADVAGETAESVEVVSVGGLRAKYTGRAAKPVDVRPDWPMLVLPSSGTTSARPKLCLHTHGGLLANTRTLAAEGTNGPAVIASAMTHMFGLQAFYAALLGGCPVALSGAWDVERFAAVAERTRPGIVFAVPTQLYDLVARGGLALGHVRTAGAVLPESLAERVRSELKASVSVIWGMSEIGYGTCTGTEGSRAEGSVGRAVSGSAVRVVDDSGVEVAAGTVGQLQYRGVGLFRGYYREPELTAAALTPDGWLRTGDMAAVLKDGTVLFHGRSQELINVGGQKFNVAEVEGLLARVARWEPLAVVAKADARLGEYPCLVVTGEVDLAEVTAFLRERGLAPYKFPLEVVRVAALPRNPAGKLDRRALQSEVAGAGESAAPPARTLHYDEALALVREHTAALVGRDAEGIAAEAGFRSQGVNSLLAVRLGNELSEATGLPLPAALVFDFPTPAAVARLLAEQPRSAPSA
ncbi:AMP-binding protein [Streptomyces sp. NBC_01506]|uniref:AMP-binding protein n=1 Tax=Streptomyces sp. NBC_01506 TaxID=2903887 RepID=UPI0038640F28